ncbi:MAG: M28 family peptidase [Sphingomicrobium sp.]
MTVAALLLAAAVTPAVAPPPPVPVEQRLAAIVSQVDEARINATVEKLVSFGTRHTLSSLSDPKRGIGAALDYAEAEFRAVGLPVVRPCDTVTGDRIPTPALVCNVVAVQRGTERPNDVVIITGHIDSRASDPMDSKSNAPGANDDGSGTAAVIEAARILGQLKFPGTIVYAALSGEEQGLYGGKILADLATTLGWNVIANLNNDIIGNSCGSDKVCDDKSVRVFSEGLRWQGGDLIRADVRKFGGENDSPSRNLSRFLDTLAEQLPAIGLDVRQIWRNDRFGRGGDHTEFLHAGYPAVRLTVAVEDYEHQHQDVRKEKGVRYGDTIDEMDFPYLAKVTKLNVAALAAIALAPPPPEPTVEGAVSTDTIIRWVDDPPFNEATRLHWRRTDSSRWEHVLDVVVDTDAHPDAPCVESIGILPGAPGHSYECTLKGTRVDDWVFGVSSVSADGFGSPIASAVPGGAFKPFVKPEEPKKDK